VTCNEVAAAEQRAVQSARGSKTARKKNWNSDHLVLRAMRAADRAALSLRKRSADRRSLGCGALFEWCEPRDQGASRARWIIWTSRWARLMPAAAQMPSIRRPDGTWSASSAGLSRTRPGRVAAKALQAGDASGRRPRCTGSVSPTDEAVGKATHQPEAPVDLSQQHCTCARGAGAVKRGGFTDIRQAAAANATGRGWCGRTVSAINTPAMPIADDAT
jgi:hypothetical protein